MIGEAEGIKALKSRISLKKCGLSVDFVCCEVRDYVPIMLKFGTKQYCTLQAYFHTPNLSLIGDRRVCTGAPNFTPLVRFGVVRCFYHQSAEQTCKKLVLRYLLLHVFYIVSRGELGRFWKYSNFRHRLILLLLLRPPVACYGEAAIVKSVRHVFAWTLY